MKSRTFLLPVALAVPTFFSTVPQTAAAEPVAARPNALLGELDTVVAAARSSSVLLDGQIVAVVSPPGASMGSSQCRTHGSKASKLLVKNAHPGAIHGKTLVGGTKAPLVKTPPKTQSKI